VSVSKLALLGSVLFASAAAASAALASASLGPPQEILREKDHKALARKLSDYLEARADETKIPEATDKFRKELVKHGKKRAGKDGNAEQEGLALSADLGRVLYFATDYVKAERKIKGGEVKEYEWETVYNRKEIKATYAVHAPSKYKAKAGPYPVLLCIPGMEGGKNQDAGQHLTEDWLNRTAELRTDAILVAIDMPEDQAAWSELTLDGAPGGVVYVMMTLKEIREKYAMDFDRTYLCGKGRGVAAAVAIASRYPHLFAGVVGRTGDAGETPPDNFRNLPTFFCGAGKQATDFHKVCEEAGFGNCTLKPDGTEADVWAWIQETPRIANPLEVSLVPGIPVPNKAYWLQVPSVEPVPGARIDARIDRESNTVTVSAVSIDRVTLYFSDQLVDLNRPITISLNGASAEYTIRRNLQTALDLCYRGTNDPGRFYVALQGFDIPEQEGDQ